VQRRAGRRTFVSICALQVVRARPTNIVVFCLPFVGRRRRRVARIRQRHRTSTCRLRSDAARENEQGGERPAGVAGSHQRHEPARDGESSPAPVDALREDGAEEGHRDVPQEKRGDPGQAGLLGPDHVANEGQSVEQDDDHRRHRGGDDEAASLSGSHLRRTPDLRRWRSAPMLPWPLDRGDAIDEWL